ncbi:hypothetical protein K501DRAFT_247500 [Backusella circina FSU 941]|nr:hypothetical protein K501DRAFT_247500 [Backusella circina FSU 941]
MFLLPFNNLPKISFHILSSLFSLKLLKKILKVSPPKHTSKPSLISPACTTTQLLLQNTKPISISSSSRLFFQEGSTHSISIKGTTVIISRLYTLEARLQLLKIKLIDELKRDPPAAQQQKPAWAQSHAYVRGVRTNCNQFLALATESNMIRANKITRTLRSRRSCLIKRKDEFIWGNSSPLRHSLRYIN